MTKWIYMLYCRARYLLEKNTRKRFLRRDDTVKIHKTSPVQMIVHRGLSGLFTENTLSAFRAAGERTYDGIESDVHRTRDGKFVIFHDDNLKRLTGVDAVVEDTDFETLRALPLIPTRLYTPQGAPSDQLHIPTLAEYIAVCMQYDKWAVLELKNRFTREDIFAICEEIEAIGYLDRVIFISFCFDNLVYVREYNLDQTVQFLVSDPPANLIETLQEHRFDLDIYHICATKKLVKQCHAAGIRVNVWTVDEPMDAARLMRCGVDYITTDILE